MTTLLPDTEFERDALDYFPTPIADSLDEAISETSSRAQRDRIVETFRVAVRLVGLLALGSTREPPETTKELLRKLVQRGLTDGEWLALARELTRPHAPDRESHCIPGLAGLFFEPAGRLKAVFAQEGPCDRLLLLRRTETVAHGVTGSESDAAEIVATRSGDLEAFLKELRWMWDLSICMPISLNSRDSGGFEYSVLNLRGVTPRRGFRPSSVQLDQHLELGSVFAHFEKRMLRLGPFIQYLESTPGQRDVFLFEEGGKRDALLRSYPGGHRRKDAATLVEIRHRLVDEAPMPPVRQGERSDWGLLSLREAALRASSEYLEKMQRERIYLPALYTRRTYLESQIASFLDRKCASSGFLIVGVSGVGKTSTLCRIVDRWSSSLPDQSDDVVLLLGGSAIPGGTFSLREILLDRLSASSSFARFVTDFSALRGASSTQLVLVVDGVDKHPQPLELLRQIDELVSRGAEHPWLKVIASVGEVAYLALQKFGFSPASRSYYSLGSTDQPFARERVEISLGPLNDEELRNAFDTYSGEQGFRPTTSLDSISEEMRNAMRNPLYLRIVMEVFDGRPIPRRPMTAEVLLQYCEKKVFNRPDRAFFVNRFLDLLYEKRVSALRFDALAEDTSLRQSVLDSSPQSIFLQLLDDQVLEEQVKRVTSILPPSRSVAFTYDRLLEYLLLNRLVERFGTSVEVLAQLSTEARDYLPLRGVLTTLLLAKVEEDALDEVADLLTRGDREVMHSAVVGLLLELDQLCPAGSASDRSARFNRLVDRILSSECKESPQLLLECTERLLRSEAFLRVGALSELLLNQDGLWSIRDRAQLHCYAGVSRGVLGERDAAMAHYLAAWEAFQESDSRDGLQEVCDLIGKEHLTRGEPQRATDWFERSLAIDEELVQLGQPGASLGKAQSLLNLAAASQQTGALDRGILSSLEAAEIFEKANDKRGQAHALTQVGNLFRRKGQIESALLQHLRALELLQQAGDRLGAAKALQSIAAGYRSQADWLEAEAHCLRAKRLFEDLGNKAGLAGALNSLGEIARAREDLEQARQYYERALELFTDTGSRGGKARCKSNLGATSLMAGDFLGAISHLEAALDLQAEILGDGRGHPDTLALMAGALLGRSLQEEALGWSDRSLAELHLTRFGEDDTRTVYWYRFSILAAMNRATEASESLRVALEDLERDAAQFESALASAGFRRALPVRRWILSAAEIHL